MNNDREWFSAHEPLADKKEREIIPPKLIWEFKNSKYVWNVIGGAIQYAFARHESDNDGTDIDEYLANMSETPKNIVFPTFNNAIVLRNVLVSWTQPDDLWK